MPEAHFEATEPHPESGKAAPTFLEQFLNNFLQERNIRWLLVVGAGIVFGSSLMLVTKAWPSWPATMKYLTILGYTIATFTAAEVGRRRLGLTATYKVLHCLTLLLLPICFLALTWLSSSTGVQGVLRKVEVIGLMIPATAFLWFASSRILDHLLRGRQTTFLISYQLLCMAGAVPLISTTVPALAFMAVCWFVFHVGVVKVNRHTFWLAEEHRLPRIFGFFPIAMLGVQFIILVATKTIQFQHGVPVAAIPMHWMGLGIAMVSATVLLTARTVADVFRQRTGNLVRPLPWNIVLPVFVGLVLAVTGLTMSFSGFHYVGPTTYAVIPTAAVVAGLMVLAAKDTRHSGFVWASLACVAIAYQCSPTLFSDIVQQIKQGVEGAIREPRLPFAFYGLTYMPLLFAVAVGSRRFALKQEFIFSQPMKHFVSIVSLALFAVSVTHTKALFFVSLANIPAFLVLALLFADRRYVLPAIGALVMAVGSAIPALNGIRPDKISPEYVATALAALATLLTATRLPDRFVNRIAIGGSILRHRDSGTDALTNRSVLLQDSDGRNRNLFQLTGCLLATLTAAHWIGHAVMHFTSPLTDAAFFQYAFMMAAFLIYTIRSPHYLSGLCAWGMLAFAGVRYAAGLHLPPETMLNVATFVTAAASLISYLCLKLSGQIDPSGSLNDLRKKLGLDTASGTLLPVDMPTSGGWLRQVQAIVVPLCDLSLISLSCLAAVIHLPLLVQIHAAFLDSGFEAGLLPTSTTVTIVWLALATGLLRSRAAGLAATAAAPLWVSALIISSGFPITIAWLSLVWALVASGTYVLSALLRRSQVTWPVVSTMTRVSEAWLLGVVVLSCMAFDLPLRIAAGIALGVCLIVDRKEQQASSKTWFAVMLNIQLLLLAAGLGGATGLTIAAFLCKTGFAVIPLTFLTAAISVAVFERRPTMFDATIATTWTALLRAGMALLATISLYGSPYAVWAQVAMLVGFVIATGVEILQAIRKQKEFSVWTGIVVSGMAAFFLFDQGWIEFGNGKSQFVLLAVSVISLCVVKLSDRYEQLRITRRPLTLIGQSLPAAVALMAVVREVAGLPTFPAANSMALMLAAGIYFQQSMMTRRRSFALMAAAILNVALMLLWWSLNLNQLEFYLVPVGLTILGFVELMKKELPQNSHDPLRYVGTLTILVSPVFEVFGGDWGHIITLMVLSVVVILLAIGLRLRALVYTGSAFLLADLVAMVLRSRQDYPFVPWLCGIVLGAAVIAFAAFCENHREKVLARIRMVTAELATWQ